MTINVILEVSEFSTAAHYQEVVMDSFTQDFRGHGGYERVIPNVPVGPFSVVVASVTEVGDINGVVTPFQGAASLSVDDVVPEDGQVRIRGSIGWDSDLDFRLSCIVG
ncbi:hypothetical protein [Streptomyces acidicola]|uniref:hypothetical protein n=1 Tax=Streptomyces acidicola TaxID=2596892 RepID=UPI00381F298C